MKTPIVGIATVLAVCCVSHCFAGEGQGAQAVIPQPTAAMGQAAGVSFAKAATTTTPTGLVATNTNSEVFANTVVGPGQKYSLESTLDYTAAATVAVTVQCVACTTAATSLATLGLSLEARWSVPGANLSVAAEGKSGTAFPYWDAAGVIFNVYGSQFRLLLQNQGTKSITIDQITFFLHSQ